MNPRAETRTIGDSVYRSLRSAIETLALPPGAELNIKDIAAELNISRSPVRDALMRLSTEGLADIFPQRGCRVSLIDLQRVKQELFLREGLEVLALARFVPLARESDLARMEEAVARQQEDVEKGDHVRLLVDDDAFHAVYFDATGQPYAREILNTYCVHYRRIRLLTARDRQIAGSVLQEHRDILNAIRLGDVERSAALEEAHLHQLARQMDKMLDTHPEYLKTNG